MWQTVKQYIKEYIINNKPRSLTPQRQINAFTVSNEFSILGKAGRQQWLPCIAPHKCFATYFSRPTLKYVSRVCAYVCVLCVCMCVHVCTCVFVHVCACVFVAHVRVHACTNYPSQGSFLWSWPPCFFKTRFLT